MKIEMIGIVLLISLITSVVVVAVIEKCFPIKRLPNKVIVDGEEIDMKRVMVFGDIHKNRIKFSVLDDGKTNEYEIAKGDETNIDE